MIAYEKARKIMLERIHPLPAERTEIVEARGSVLAEDVISDVDLPPFDKSAMDGFAVRSEDLTEVPVELEIVEDIPAGSAPTRTVGPGQCARIMTGAPVPSGADKVIRVEDTAAAGAERVHILKDMSKSNICQCGEDLRAGDLALSRGHVVGAAEVGVLASVGGKEVSVHRRPRVAVLATGDELVDIASKPGPGQIRNANTYSLLALCKQGGFSAESLGVADDTKEELQSAIARGLDYEVLLVSGGVSVGDYDFVKGILSELGIQAHFTRVAIKPGMPTVFATKGEKLVFGIPGNPVSTIVVFALFVEPALRRLAGHTRLGPPTMRATLTAPVEKRRKRQTYLPVRLTLEQAGLQAAPVGYHGSADLAALARADGWAIIAVGKEPVPVGTEVDVIRLER